MIDAPAPPCVRYDRMLIAGEWCAAASGHEFAVENPARRTQIATVPRGEAADVDRAARAAADTFAGWARMPPRERGRALLRIADAIEDQAEDIARILAMETGNALRTQARPEVRGTADVFRYFGGLGGELKGETVPFGDQMLSYTRRQPLGVVGAIVPWNAPVQIAALKIAPALCAGNTVVLKTAEDAPLATLAMAALCQQFLPAGVLNVLTGTGRECGVPLAAHPEVAKLSFTGSTAVGKGVMHAAAERVVPVSLELGGKNPSIVFPDCDEDWVVDGVIAAMRFTRQGQSCTAGSRLLLHADIFDSFLAKLEAKVTALRLGDPLDETTDIGAVINENQHRRVTGFVSDGIASSDARLIFGGLPPTVGPLSEGHFAIPTVFEVAQDERILQREEIFGPVLVATRWQDEAEAVRIANATHYGLAAYVWSRDIGQALRTAHAVDAGWVQVNQGGGQQLGQSFGGVKQSGLGRECSLEGMLEGFTERRSVNVNLTVPARTAA